MPAARTPSLVTGAALLALAACASPAPPPTPAPPPAPAAADSAAPPAAVELLATWELSTGHRAGDTEVGGLSALAWDPDGGLFHALSDDRGEAPRRGPARLYALRLVPGEGTPLGGVEVAAVTVLTRDGAPLPAGRIDLEGLAFAGAEGFWIASEGVAGRDEPPFVRLFGRDGAERAALPVPARFFPARGRGVRDNLGFEALAITPDGGHLIAGVESALVQDGPPATDDRPALVRLVVWDLAAGEPVAEHAYAVDPLPWPSALPGTFRVSGLVELVALDRRRLLALERAFAAHRGNALKLYRVDLAAAGDVSAVESLAAAGAALRPAAKELLFDVGAALARRGVALDNLEGMAFGPDLPDGRRLLLLVADNNFSSGQRTLFVALAVPPEALE